MRRKSLLFFFFILSAAIAFGQASFSTRISAGHNDAEENGPSSEFGHGSMYMTSSDLELVDDGHLQTIGLRFTDVQIPDNVDIQNAYIRFTADGGSTDSTSLYIKAENSVNSPAFDADVDFNVSNRKVVDDSVLWEDIEEWTSDVVYQTPDLSALVQSVVSHGNWEAGNAMTFIINGVGNRRAYSYEGDAGKSPELVLEFYYTGTIHAKIMDGNDDGEENGPNSDFGHGNMYMTSSDLELVEDGKSHQTLGLHFTNLTVPQGAMIDSAHIQFTADGSSAGDDSLYFKVESTSNAGPFDPDNQFDFSGRMVVNDSVAWKNIPDWSAEEAGADQRTPGLSRLIQEIVNLNDWTAGNNINFIITGGGTRRAYSFEGDEDKAPSLYIRYLAEEIDLPPMVVENIPNQHVKAGWNIHINLHQYFNDIDSEYSLSASLSGDRDLPDWLTLSNGMLSGTPDEAVVLPVFVTASSKGRSVTDMFMIYAEPSQSPMLTQLGTIDLGGFDEGAAEISAYDAGTQRLFVTNAEEDVIEIIDMSDPTSLSVISSIDFTTYGDGVNSVAVYDGLLAAAIEADPKQDPGKVVVFDMDGNHLWNVEVGSLPDMVTFTPDGKKILVANEGEPSDDYQTDPQGSISIIDTTTKSVSTADFTSFIGQEDALIAEGVRIFGPNANAAEDLEPEYITVNESSDTAYVTLQENNALAIVDIANASVVDVIALGYKDHNQPGNGLDASNKSDFIDIRPWPVMGMYQPDAIASYKVDGTTYLVTANEGDAREYEAEDQSGEDSLVYTDESEVGDVMLDDAVFGDVDYLKDNNQLGKLGISIALPDTNDDGEFKTLYSYGARSFAIWNAETGELVYDSGDELEQITGAIYPDNFNSSDDDTDAKDRSDNKGPEPEAVAIGEIDGKTYAFVGLERIGGIMVYDITDPMNAKFVEYTNNRDFSKDPEKEDDMHGDNGPEGLVFIPSDKSPNGQHLVVVSSEISGTVTTYSVGEAKAPYTLAILHNNDGESDMLGDSIMVGGSKILGGSVAQFKATVDSLRDAAVSRGYGSIMLSSGDNFLAGKEFNASQANEVYYDAIALDAIDYDAICIGNHDFDFGAKVLAEMIEAFETNKAPYLSSNLGFSQEPELNALAQNGRVKPYTIVQKGNEQIGVVGLTTPKITEISSPGKVDVSEAIVDSVQKYVDTLVNKGINKIILISHLQSVNEDTALIKQISGIDIVIAGGGDELLANDPVLGGPYKNTIFGSYPMTETDKDGNEVYIVTTPGNYRFLGQLIVDFDAEGKVIRVYDSNPVLVKGQENTQLKTDIIEPINTYIEDLTTNIIAETEVELEFRRDYLRTQETNGGNLVADALLWQAKQTYSDYNVKEPHIALQNGGGLRLENTIPAGDFEEVLTYDICAFTNILSVIEDIPAAELKKLIENGVSNVENTDGRFPHVAGFHFVYNPEGAPGHRVIDITLEDGTELVKNGEPVPGAPAVTMATIDFLANGGDGYPFDGMEYKTLGATYQQALFNYITDENGLDSMITNADYPVGGEGRIMEKILIPVTSLPFYEDFDDGLEGWKSFSVTGDQQWEWVDQYGVDGSAQMTMSGYDGGAHENEDWLISPAFDVSNTSTVALSFQSNNNYNGPDMEVKYSTDWDGIEEPNEAIWMDYPDVMIAQNEDSWIWEKSGTGVLELEADTFFMAFVYHSTASEAGTWEVDSVVLNKARVDSAVFPIMAGNDDAEENGPTSDFGHGGMYMNSSDLELVDDGHLQTVGLRFTGLDIPRGAMIQNAFIQFTVDETSDENTSLYIGVENADDALPFDPDVDFNISDRNLITMDNGLLDSVYWGDIPAWSNVGEAGSDQRTPDLSHLVEDVVSKPGWKEGNAMVFVIKGQGKRIAEAFEGDESLAPELIVQYEGEILPKMPELISEIPDLRTYAGWSINYDVKPHFEDKDSKLHFSASLSGDRELPEWLHFENGIFTGTYDKALALPVFVTAESKGDEVTDMFMIYVEPEQTPILTQLGTINLGTFDEGAAEISAYDAGTQRLFVTNAEEDVIEIIDMSDPTSLSVISSIDFTTYGDGVNSVAVYDGLLAAAIEADPKQDPGKVVVFDMDGNHLWNVEVGSLPDMVTFTPDGKKILVANEGEPSDDYQNDPEGSISIIDTTTKAVSTADFTSYIGQEAALIEQGIRIFGPNANAAQDLEPEYITVDATSDTAYVSLQENNAIAVVDIANAQVVDIWPMGYKDHSSEGNGLDASNKADFIDIRPWPVMGIYQPDALASYEVNGTTYLVTANEGDAREYEAEDQSGEDSLVYTDESEVGDIDLDEAIFGDADYLQENENLGKLGISIALADTNSEGEYKTLYSYGARSFSIWNGETGELVYDSGDELEQITAALYPDNFNSSDDDTDAKDRSDNKGPEPEAVTIGEINGTIYAFVGLERIGGVMVYDITDPKHPEFVEYKNNRDFSTDPEDDFAIHGDNGPEGLVFIPSDKSPNGQHLVVVSNEISGTVTVYSAGEAVAPYTLSILHNNDGESDMLGEMINVYGKEMLGGSVAQFKATVDSLRDLATNRGYESIMLSSGDNFLAGKEFNASQANDVYYDALALDAIDYDAICMGNHDFDFGPKVLAELIDAFETNKAPYLSANLAYGEEPELQALADADRIKSYTMVDKGGEQIGVIGLTTPSITVISSPGKVDVSEATVDSVQKYVDELTTHGVNKIILISHLQSINEDTALISQINGVDIVIAGGGDELLTNNPLIGEPYKQMPFGPYPLVETDKDGNEVYIVTTPGSYRYVGQLIVDFDGEGNVTRIYEGSDPVLVVGKEDQQLKTDVIDPINDYIEDLTTNIIAETEVELEYRREFLRTRETNGGNLVADALLWQAKETAGDFGVKMADVSIQNGGGLRLENTVPVGDFAEVLTYDICAFPNNLAVIENVSAEDFLKIMNHAVGDVENTGGRFAQIAGFKIVYNPEGPVEDRIISISFDDGTIIVENGTVVKDTTINIATIDYLAGGGDGYPYDDLGYDYKTLGATYQQALLNYVTAESGLDSVITTADYPLGGEGRVMEEIRISITQLPFYEDFDDGLKGWKSFSVTGDQQWEWVDQYGVDGSAQMTMSGYDGGAHENEDWLISPAMDISMKAGVIMSFQSNTKYDGPAMEVKYSTDWNGIEDPSAASWLDYPGVQVAQDNSDWLWEKSGDGILEMDADTMFVAFVYHSTASEAATWEVDSVVLDTYKPDTIEVSNLADLRAMDADNSTIYRVTGEVVLTFQQDYRNKKYIQDGTAGIEIDDDPGMITTSYNVGDGITGLTGRLEEWNGLLQIHPLEDAGAASSAGNDITPVSVSIDEFKTNFEDYEAEIVKIDEASFEEMGNFENGTNYHIFKAGDTTVFRSHFYNVDYIGTNIPQKANLTGIAIEYKGTAQLAARDSNDIDRIAVPDTIQVPNLAELRTKAADNFTVYQITGEVVLTFQQDYRNKKYIQDGTAGIEIDDDPGMVTTAYNVGDGILGLTGTLEEYNGLLQIHPVKDPGAATSVGNPISPVTVTIAEFKANFEDYEAEVVSIDTVEFEMSGEFETGTNYDILRGPESTVFRTHFYDADYIGTTIPGSANITGIAIEYQGTAQLAARDSNDIEIVNPTSINSGMISLGALNVYPNPASEFVNIELPLDVFDAQVELMDLSGNRLLMKKANSSVVNIDISNLYSGVYVVRVITENHIYINRMVVR